jgi:hypothetical protein
MCDQNIAIIDIIFKSIFMCYLGPAWLFNKLALRSTAKCDQNIGIIDIILDPFLCAT